MNMMPLRRAIVKEFVMLSIVVVLAAGGVWSLMALHDDYELKKSNASRITNELMAQKQSLETRFTAVKDNMQVYEESQRWANAPGLFIDSQAIRDLFNYYQSVLFIKKMSVEMQPIVDMTAEQNMAREHFVVTKTNAKVAIEAVSDEDIYALIRVMQRELPGFMRITSFSLKRSKDLNKDILAEVRRQGTSSVVVADLQFEWYGLKATDSASKFNRYVAPQRKDKPK